MKITELFDKPRTFIDWYNDNWIYDRINKAHTFLSLNAKDVLIEPEEPKKVRGKINRAAYRKWQNWKCPFLGKWEIRHMTTGGFSDYEIFFVDGHEIGIDVSVTMDELIGFYSQSDIPIPLQFNPEYEI